MGKKSSNYTFWSSSSDDDDKELSLARYYHFDRHSYHSATYLPKQNSILMPGRDLFDERQDDQYSLYQSPTIEFEETAEAALKREPIYDLDSSFVKEFSGLTNQEVAHLESDMITSIADFRPTDELPDCIECFSEVRPLVLRSLFELRDYVFTHKRRLTPDTRCGEVSAFLKRVRSEIDMPPELEYNMEATSPGRYKKHKPDDLPPQFIKQQDVAAGTNSTIRK